MDQLALAEQKKYDTVWRELPEYRDFCPADFLAPAFLDFFKDEVQRGDSVIDFGCGTGKSAFPLLEAGLWVHLIDFSDYCMNPEVFMLTVKPKSGVYFSQECLWSLSNSIEPADWILCFDVLEHIPEEKINKVLEAIAFRMKKGGFLSICLHEDTSGAAFGEILHLTVKPSSWWRKRISRYFSIFHEFGSEEKNLVLSVRPLA